MIQMSRYAQTCPVLYGSGIVNKLGDEVKGLGCSRVLVVSDPNVILTAGYRQCIESLRTADVAIVEYSKVLADPPDYIVEEGGKLAVEEQVDGIVAIGGGSTMDAAKGMNILINNPGPIQLYFGNPLYTPGVALVMVPTTAGTGSECTSVGVITDTQNGSKNSVICNSTLALLDPEMTYEVPPDVVTSTGMDILAQAAESITACFPNPKSQLLAADSIRRVVRYLPRALANPADIEARDELAIASNLTGIAFNDALVHLGHAIAHVLGAKFHLVHGTVCGIQLPEVMKYAAEIDPKRVEIVGKALGLEFDGEEKSGEIGEKVAVELRSFARSIGIPSLSVLGVSREALIETAPFVQQDPCYSFVPRELTVKEIEAILGAMYDNYN